jgi:alpha-galactosidase
MQILKPGIEPHLQEHVWYITTRNTCYVIGVEKASGTVLNLYWGPRLLTPKDIDLPVKLPEERSSQDPAMTSATEEFPAFGGLRYGPDVLRIKFDNGTRELDLVYTHSRVATNKRELVLTLVDRKHYDCQVKLIYQLDIDNDLIIRQTHISNLGELSRFVVSKAQTCAWHIPAPANHSQRELFTLAGAWACETQVQRHSLRPGTSQVLESTRGIPSAQAYPYFAIKDSTSDGEHNDCEVYFGSLGWSGNWKIEAHTDIEGKLIVTGGIHDRDFEYCLTANDPVLELPTFVAGYTAEGLSGARRSLANYIRDNRDLELVAEPDTFAPVLYNGWEAYAFNVNLENQKQMAKKAAELGMEMFVLDDGWFHNRNSDKAGLGDWFADQRKFPEGLKPLADYVHNLGMKFGVWFEPEMVNPDSNLYREHPDWVYHYPDRTRHLERNQLVLNIGKPEVFNYLSTTIIALVNSVGIDYIKWDMNRPISEAGSEYDQEVWVEHVLCFERLVKKIKQSTGLVRIETCCSGGGRADLSVLKRVESCWPSDNTRPDARLMIQYGASFVMPSNIMSCWVTDSPNDDPFSLIPISYRFHVSFMGSLGIGSDLNKLHDDDAIQFLLWIQLYKKLRHVLQFGNLDWLVVPNASQQPCSYTAVTQTNLKMGNEAVVLAFRQTSPFWLPLRPIRLRRLIAFALYDVCIWGTDPGHPVYEGTKSGAVLMHKGLDLPYLTSKSYSSVVVHIKQKA